MISRRRSHQIARTLSTTQARSPAYMAWSGRLRSALGRSSLLGKPSDINGQSREIPERERTSRPQTLAPWERHGLPARQIPCWIGTCCHHPRARSMPAIAAVGAITCRGQQTRSVPRRARCAPLPVANRVRPYGQRFGDDMSTLETRSRLRIRALDQPAARGCRGPHATQRFGRRRSAAAWRLAVYRPAPGPFESMNCPH
jgi:hypothetical protein